MADKQPRIAYCGYAQVMDNSAVAKQPSKSTTTREMTSRSNNYDKQSGSYMRGTAKETYSSGDYTNRGNTGYKDEYKSSSTVRVGDKSGYTEYYKQEKVTRVEYDNYNNSNNYNRNTNYNSNNYIDYNSHNSYSGDGQGSNYSGGGQGRNYYGCGGSGGNYSGGEQGWDYYSDED